MQPQVSAPRGVAEYRHSQDERRYDRDDHDARGADEQEGAHDQERRQQPGATAAYELRGDHRVHRRPSQQSVSARPNPLRADYEHERDRHYQRKRNRPSAALVAESVREGVVPSVGIEVVRVRENDHRRHRRQRYQDDEGALEHDEYARPAQGYVEEAPHEQRREHNVERELDGDQRGRRLNHAGQRQDEYERESERPQQDAGEAEAGVRPVAPHRNQRAAGYQQNLDDEQRNAVVLAAQNGDGQPIDGGESEIDGQQPEVYAPRARRVQPPADRRTRHRRARGFVHSRQSGSDAPARSGTFR